jgi:hypothetical protein
MWGLALFFALIFVMCAWLSYEYRRIVQLERKAAERERLMRELYRKGDDPRPHDFIHKKQ